MDYEKVQGEGASVRSGILLSGSASRHILNIDEPMLIVLNTIQRILLLTNLNRRLKRNSLDSYRVGRGIRFSFSEHCSLTTFSCLQFRHGYISYSTL